MKGSRSALEVKPFHGWCNAFVMQKVVEMRDGMIISKS